MTCTLLPYEKVSGVCDHCGTELEGRRRRWCSSRCSNVYRRNHRWSLARNAARRRDKCRCVKCGNGWPDFEIEVNHIDPVNGQGYGWSCKHHLENLQTLCKSCHKTVTAEQRRTRKQLAA